MVRFPLPTLVIALAAAGASLWLTVTQLGFRTSRAELLSPNSDYNRRWLEYTKEFGDKEDVVVVVEGESRRAGRRRREGRLRRAGPTERSVRRGAARDRRRQAPRQGPLLPQAGGDFGRSTVFWTRPAPFSRATGRR